MSERSDVTEKIIAWSALTLFVISVGMSLSNVTQTVIDQGVRGNGAWVTALLPEISLALCVLKLRYGGMSRFYLAVVVVVAVSAFAFTAWGNLEQAEPNVSSWIVHGYPAWTALGAMLMVKMKTLRKDVVQVETEMDVPSQQPETQVETASAIPPGRPETTIEISAEPAPRRVRTARVEMIETLRHELADHPDWTVDQWSAHHGVARSTMAAYLKDARKPHAVKREAHA